MGGAELRVEVTGETVGEAKWHALRELERRRPGLDRTVVRFEVLSEGERGLLGVGYAPARVAATALVEEADGEAEPPPGGDTPAERVRALVARVAASIGVDCAVEVEEREDTLEVTCSGGDVALLIGKHGQTIDAIQYLANAIAARDQGEVRREVVVDAAGYRARRRAALEALARRAADDALRTAGPVALEPMTAVERKVVHLALRDDAGVRTWSDGTEPNRHVVVAPAGE